MARTLTFRGQPQDQHGLAEFRMAKQLMNYVDKLMATDYRDIDPNKLPELPGDGAKIKKIVGAWTAKREYSAALIPNPSNVCIRGRSSSELSQALGYHSYCISVLDEHRPSERYNLGEDFARRLDYRRQGSKQGVLPVLR